LCSWYLRCVLRAPPTQKERKEHNGHKEKEEHNTTNRLKEIIFLSLLLSFTCQLKAQPGNCIFKQPFITIHFGAGNVRDVNTALLYNYERVKSYCPDDGHYTYTGYTSDCFNGNWHTITEDHTPGDASGNMLLVNSSYNIGMFFSMPINGLKSGTTYEFALWLMNVCKISQQCPFPLLPNITIRLQTMAGKTIAQFNTGEIPRHEAPHWTRYAATFTTPPSETSLRIIMINNNPGGCGNDFAMDDISFRECIKPVPVVIATPKTVAIKKQSITVKPVPKKTTPSPVKTQPAVPQTVPMQKDTQQYSTPLLKIKQPDFPAPPLVLRTRTNALVKQIETEAGEIKIDLYDNGEIDGDTVSIYHNNTLLKADARLSSKPITLHITVDAEHPHHELIMVAENLGSIPPNTSLMIITAGSKRYQVFISSNEQKNAKVVLDLKE
jgi:hypothetical protein